MYPPLSLFSARVPHAHLLPEQGEVLLVRDEAEHDEVGIEAVEAVPQVVPPVRLCLSRLADVVHHLEQGQNTRYEAMVTSSCQHQCVFPRTTNLTSTNVGGTQKLRRV